jgi:CRP-like cAMP-binding protein
VGQVGEALARHLACIGELEPEDREALVGIEAEVRTLRRGADALQRGDQPTSVVVVLDGMLYRYSMGAEGARQVHSFYIGNEAPCLETLYLDYMDNNLGAVVDSTIGVIPHPQLYRLIDERPGVRKLIWRQTLVQGAIFREWLMRNSNLPAHACIAHFFCEMVTRARAAGLADGTSIDLPVTQQLLSDAIGLTPVHTNRTLMLLRETGAVEWRAGKLTVHDWEKLCALSDFDPYYLHLRP